MLKTARSFQEALSHYLTPQLWKQVLGGLATHAGGFAVDAATLVLGRVDDDVVWRRFARRTLRRGAGFLCVLSPKAASAGRFPSGFQMALARLTAKSSCRAGAAALRQQLAQRFVDALRIGKGGYVPLGCDGSRLECPRSQQLQERLGEAGKTDSPPMAYVSALCAMLSRDGFRDNIPPEPRESMSSSRGVHAFAGLGRRDGFDGGPRKHGTPVEEASEGTRASPLQNRAGLTIFLPCRFSPPSCKKEVSTKMACSGIVSGVSA